MYVLNISRILTVDILVFIADIPTEPELMISQVFLTLEYSSFVGDIWNRENRSGVQLMSGAKAENVHLPDARDQAETNPGRVHGVAGELYMEHVILKRCSDHEQNHQD